MMLGLALLLAAAATDAADLRADIRAHAQREYGGDCVRIELPDRSFIALDVAGAPPVTAVTFGRAGCISASRFSGTGGILVQFWTPHGLALGAQMYGFDTRGGHLTSLQSGLACPAGDGSNLCWVSYRWNAVENRFEIAGLALETAPLEAIPIAHDWAEIGN